MGIVDSLLSLLCSVAVASPLFPVSNEEIVPLLPGTTEQISEDLWNKALPESVPDRSYRNVWVRMFPLLKVPLGDPYPETKELFAVSLYNSGGMKIYSMDDGTLLTSGKSLIFDFAKEQVKVDGVAYTLETLWIVVTGNKTTTAKWDSDRVRIELRGGFVIDKSLHKHKDVPEQELWSLINVVSMNDYLRSVVPSEVIASWNRETLRAQAIAARTYGLYEVASARLKGKDYDLDPTTWYQSYQGQKIWISGAWRTIELSATSEAVAFTGNKVLTYDGEVIKALFSSNSGGRTCTMKECLETENDVPYLREVDDAAGIKASPGGTWGTKATITPAGIRERLIANGVTPASTVVKLEHLERGISGRTWRLRVVLKEGAPIDLDRALSRKLMPLFGAIRSFQYELGNVSGGKQSIKGHGYGHAVGLSQWGAQLFAKAGWNAERILTHYYYGVKIQEL